MKLVLVRHGQTASNVSGALDTGRPGMPLTSHGHAQAQSLVERWEQIAPRPHALAVSPLLRTRQTAQPLIDHFNLNPMVCDGLREIRSGNLEMSAALMNIAQYMLAVRPWIEGQWEPRMPGGENGYELRTRFMPPVLRVIQEAMNSGGDDGVAVIVAHGAINRVIASTLSPDIGANLVMMHRLDNTGTCVLETQTGFDPTHTEDLVEAFTALTWNDVPLNEWEIPTEVHAALTYEGASSTSVGVKG